MVGLSQMNRSSLRERERERKREREREGEGERDVFLHSWNACQSRVPWRFAGKTVCVWMMASIYLYLSIYLSVERHGSTVHLVKPSLQLAFCQEPFIILWQPLGTISNAHTGPRISVRKEAAATAGTPPSLSGSGA